MLFAGGLTSVATEAFSFNARSSSVMALRFELSSPLIASNLVFAAACCSFIASSGPPLTDRFALRMSRSLLMAKR